MLLLTFNEWLGPSRDYRGETPKTSSERHVSFATSMELGPALVAVHEYQNTYNVRYYPAMALALRLLSVATIADISEDVLARVDVTLLETALARMLRG